MENTMSKADEAFIITSAGVVILGFFSSSIVTSFFLAHIPNIYN